MRYGVLLLLFFLASCAVNDNGRRYIISHSSIEEISVQEERYERDDQ